ncbi:type I phosphodiesterase/nucleotide pyrophosphatase [unidentified eubacterium SCB49]|nr:type I phosphodiesterase/nucleotide pyrophosphatase [unidentified eubacterium SCB49]
MKKNKTLLLGWDAADWKIIGPLMAKGQMPNLKKLIQNGVYGNMSTMNPPFSPMLWSSVATGKTPDKHGVLGFIEVVSNKTAVRPVTARSRKARAIWNILHHEGYKSNVVGWWPSFPAEPINGVVVTDKFQKVGSDPTDKKPLVEGAIHPREMTGELKDFRMYPFEVTKEHILPFIPDAAKIDQDSKSNGLLAFAQILSHNVSLHNASTYLLRKTEWDFMAIYFDFIDHFCHSFMKYHPPKHPQVEQEMYDIYNQTVNGAYRFQDMMLGRVMDLVDEDTTIIVMSDHGFESGNRRILNMPKLAAAPALDHRQFGIFVASGPNIKKNEKIFGLSLIDVAPTILHQFDLPVGRDMDGKVLLDIFEKPTQPKYIDSWENVEGDFGELEKENIEEALSDDETMEQLIELGYIDKPDDEVEVSVAKVKCDLRHNLAKVLLGKKDLKNAKNILIELTKTDAPVDKSVYYLDILNVCLAQKEYDEAENYFDIFKKLAIKSEINYNTYFIESEILNGKGKFIEALNVLLEVKKRHLNQEILYRIANTYFNLQKFNEAKCYYEQAIDLEPDKAKFHRALAETLFELGDYQESVEHSLISIELVKYYPNAHYMLGKALEKLGDLDNAKIAFETAARLTPKTYHRAEKALENVEEKITTPIELRDKNMLKYRKDQIVVVSGLPRSGTSLMMQMLDKGGLTSLIDDERKADESNPKGYFELKEVMSIHKDNSWMEKAKNTSVKIVAPLLSYMDMKYRYKVIFMKRDLDEVIKSQRKMTGKNTDVLPVKLYNAYRNQLKIVEIWKEKEPGVELIYVDYKDVLEKPQEMAKKVSEFVGLELDIDAMASCVDKSLYRNKV